MPSFFIASRASFEVKNSRSLARAGHDGVTASSSSSGMPGCSAHSGQPRGKLAEQPD